MDGTRIWLLLARKFSGEATLEELTELEEIFKCHPDLQYAYTLIGELKDCSGDEGSLSEEDKECMIRGQFEVVEDLLEQLPESPAKTKHPRYRGRLWQVAASFALLLGIGLLYYYAYPRKHPSSNGEFASEIRHQKVYVASEASAIILKDGTKVWLNSGSMLKCSNDFNTKNREVTIAGEAFFKVAKDVKRPFVVHAGDLVNVKVLGTSFNIKAYPGDPYIETSLVSGKIAVNFTDKSHKEVILKPKEKITVFAGKIPDVRHLVPEVKPIRLKYSVARLTPNPVDHTLSETSWMQNKLAFSNMTFEELAYDLERIYHVKIIFGDDRLQKYHLTGVFKHECLDNVLRALQVTTPFQYSIVDKKVTIYP